MKILSPQVVPIPCSSESFVDIQAMQRLQQSVIGSHTQRVKCPQRLSPWMSPALFLYLWNLPAFSHSAPLPVILLLRLYWANSNSFLNASSSGKPVLVLPDRIMPYLHCFPLCFAYFIMCALPWQDLVIYFCIPALNTVWHIIGGQQPVWTTKRT